MFHITSYLLILLGILCLPLVEGIDSVSSLSFLLFTFGYIYTQAYNKSRLSKGACAVLLIIAVALGSIALLIIGKLGEWEIIWFSWHVMLSIQITSIFRVKDKRGWIFSYLISLSQIAIAGVFTERGFFLILFPFCLVLTVFNFILLLLKTEIKEKPLEFLKSKIALMKWGAITTAHVFFITIAMFFVLPRTKSPLFELKKQMHLVDKLKEGDMLAEKMVKENFEMKFPEKPILGNFSDIKNDDVLIMVVETTKPFLWRVKAFNNYEDGEWSLVGSKPVRIDIKDKQVHLRPLYFKDALFVQMNPGQFHHQKFYIKNYAQNLLISSYPLIEIENISGSNISIDHFENIYLENKIRFGNEYEVISIDKRYSSDYLRSLSRMYPEEIINLYLKLPVDLDKRILDLTKKVLKNAPQNIYDELVILREYLKKNCQYGLINRSNRPDLSEFLFGKKEGDCEYFATALALMLRIRNIPTRFVIGFSGGEFDAQKRTSLVYAKNAHAWIEVFFPNIGWLPCDVAPGPGDVYQKQWADIPKVMVLKPDEGASIEQSTAEELPGKSQEAEDEGSGKGEEVIEEGVPENELLPEEYFFRKELNSEKTTQEEMAFGKEFFEEDVISKKEVKDEMAIEEGEIIQDEILKEELPEEEIIGERDEFVDESIEEQEVLAQTIEDEQIAESSLEGVDEELEEGLAEEQEVLAQAIEDEQIAESS
ncbi:MAG: transglutaminaseTgpA domain-containing protein, partial [Candidatus Saelkia tenebricola]|nr:transglutaminaseTgpA domain-containing protein [Candidatus Saelkia tenebricola]